MLISDGSFVTVQGWMLNRLKLERNEIVIFAIIYGFSKDGVGWFEGSRKYLSEWTGYSTRVVSRVLKSLYEKNYLKKEEIRKDRTLKLVRYQVNRKAVEDVLAKVDFENKLKEYDKVAEEHRKINKLSLDEADKEMLRFKVSKNIHHG